MLWCVEKGDVLGWTPSKEESESESVDKSFNTNREKYAVYKTEDEEPSVTYNPGINEPRYSNLSNCGKTT